MESNDLTWLDPSVVEKVLQKTEKEESIRVVNIIVEPATAKGDNYLSDLLRVVIQFTRNHIKGHKIKETLSVVAKIQPQDGGAKELIRTLGIFETEISMMLETLPKINQILAESNAPSLAAQCLYVQNEDPIHLIMEDLAPGGFQMVSDRQTGLDLDHCLLVFRNLAVFHASSVALVEKDPEAVRIYKNAILNKDYNIAGAAFFNGGTRALAKEAIDWPGLSPRIVEKVLRLSTCIFEKACEAAQFREDDFNVLNHGDFWTNNMMFRYDERRKPIDIKFVDFQFSFYGSPAVDILYFLGVIASEDIRMNHRELLLREYHDSLTSTMAKLECKTMVPSFENLKEILRKRILIEVISTFKILPLILVDTSQVSDYNDVVDSDGKSKNPYYQGYMFRNVMTKILLWYDDMGLLESL